MAEQEAARDAIAPAGAAAGDIEAELMDWAATVCGGSIERSVQASGGNRCRSWAMDVRIGNGETKGVFLRYGPARPPGAEPYTVRREAEVYRVIDGSGAGAPRLLGLHAVHDAILTERAEGQAEFRHLRDERTKQAIIVELMQSLAALHALPTAALNLAGGVSGRKIIDHVKAELAIWRAMYDETARADPLLEFAFAWLEGNLPDPEGKPSLVHGDAGPGNFMFEGGRLTAVIDWELAHVGDPMEDLAWFSMRSVMEPAPDFAGALAAYEKASGRAIDRQRILYHRVFVSTRVVVIRHRNVTGEPANTIVSRGLNRRLLVEAIAGAAGIRLPEILPLAAPPTEQTALFDAVIDDLRDIIVPGAKDGAAAAAGKNAAKVLKHLRDVDRFGDVAQAANLAALRALLAEPVETVAAGEAMLTERLRQGRVSLDAVLICFAGQAAREAQLAASASGGIAHRHYPELPSGGSP